MNDNVISFGSRKPLAQEQAEAAVMREELEKAKAQALSVHQETTLEMLDKVRTLVADGRLQGLVLVGKDPHTGLFLTEVAMHGQVTPPAELFGYVGALETIKIELADAAMMAPVLMTDGSVSSPDDDGYEEDFE